MKEKTQIDIELGSYDEKKQFKKVTELTEREYLALVTVILNYLDTLTPETV